MALLATATVASRDDLAGRDWAVPTAVGERPLVQPRPPVLVDTPELIAAEKPIVQRMREGWTPTVPPVIVPLPPPPVVETYTPPVVLPPPPPVIVTPIPFLPPPSRPLVQKEAPVLASAAAQTGEFEIPYRPPVVPPTDYDVTPTGGPSVNPRPPVLYGQPVDNPVSSPILTTRPTPTTPVPGPAGPFVPAQPPQTRPTDTAPAGTGVPTWHLPVLLGLGVLLVLAWSRKGGTAA